VNPESGEFPCAESEKASGIRILGGFFLKLVVKAQLLIMHPQITSTGHRHTDTTVVKPCRMLARFSGEVIIAITSR
jgi:hypothetical protein